MWKAVEVIGQGGIPVGAMVAFLLIALVAATQRGVRHGGGRRETRRIWNLWLLGPATVVSLLLALFIVWKMHADSHPGVLTSSRFVAMDLA